jgi:toluene monooxygenase electron transfer component
VIHFEVGLAAPMTFDAGQFVVLKVPGLDGARAYSMVNFQRDCSRIDLVIKRKHGAVSAIGCLIGRSAATRSRFSDRLAAHVPSEEDRDLLMIAEGPGSPAYGDPRSGDRRRLLPRP